MPKKETDHAEKQSQVGKIIKDVSFWTRDEAKDDDEIEQRLNEYFELCGAREEMPMFETMCLYLGTSDDKGKEWCIGENCSGRRTTLMQNALAMLKAIEGKAVYQGLIRDVPYIWRSKQYFGYREPNSRLEDLLVANVLKELPSAESISKKYLLEVDETESEEERE